MGDLPPAPRPPAQLSQALQRTLKEKLKLTPDLVQELSEHVRHGTLAKNFSSVSLSEMLIQFYSKQQENTLSENIEVILRHVAANAELNLIVKFYQSNLAVDKHGLKTLQLLLPSFACLLKRLWQEGLVGFLLYLLFIPEREKKAKAFRPAATCNADRGYYQYIGDICAVLLQLAGEVKETAPSCPISLQNCWFVKRSLLNCSLTFFRDVQIRDIDDAIRRDFFEDPTTYDLSNLQNRSYAKAINILLKFYLPSKFLTDSLESLARWREETEVDRFLELRDNLAEARMYYLYIVLIRHVEVGPFPKVYTFKYLFLNAAPAIQKMYPPTQYNLQHVSKVVELATYFAEQIEDRSLETSDFVQSKVNGNKIAFDVMRFFVEVYTSPCMRRFKSDSHCLIGLLLDLFVWRDRFRLNFELLVRGEPHDDFVTEKLISYFLERLQRFCELEDVNDAALTTVPNIIGKTFRVIFNFRRVDLYHVTATVARFEVLEWVLQRKTADPLPIGDLLTLPNLQTISLEFVNKLEQSLLNQEEMVERLLKAIVFHPSRNPPDLNKPAQYVWIETTKIMLSNLVLIRKKLTTVKAALEDTLAVT